MTGRVSQTGFPSPITEVRVVRGSAIVATSQVASDGTFELALAPANGLALQAIGAGKSGVVFPRTSGTLDRTFVVHAAGPAFDVGTLRFIGSATTSTFSFKTAATESECHDGKDSTGATCVDDEDTSSGTCSHDDGTETEDNGGTDDLADDGDAVADHNFPVDGCTEDGGGDGSGGSGDGSGGSGSGGGSGSN